MTLTRQPLQMDKCAQFAKGKVEVAPIVLLRPGLTDATVGLLPGLLAIHTKDHNHNTVGMCA